MKTYTGKEAEKVDNVISDLSSEAAKVTELVHVRRVLLQELQSILNQGVEVLVLELDNVSSGDREAITGNDEWRWFWDGCRESESQRQKCEEK